MANALPNVGKASRYGDLKRRLLFLLAALVVFRIGAHIPVPGIDPHVLADLFKDQQGGILGMFNMFSGGALRRFTIFALGIMPYISASIIMHPLTALLIAVAVIAVTGFVCFVERGQRKILVNYAKRQVGNRVYGGQSSHLPFKLNMSGVIPPIFASSLILFPATLLGWFGSAEGMIWLRDIAGTLTPGQPIYVLLYAALIVFFCFFYTALQYNPKETADNLKKSGAFVPGIRPGEQTARYLEKILTRLTLAGAAYVTLVCLLPEFLILKWNVPFYFGGTSLLIIVVVTMDFMAQVQAYIMTHQYESLLKKANFKGAGFPTR